MNRLRQRAFLWVGATCGLLALVLSVIMLLQREPGEPAEVGTAKESRQVSAKSMAQRPVIRELRRFEGHTGTVLGVAFSPDGERAISADQHAVHIWERRTGKKIHGIETRNKSWHTGTSIVVFSDDRKRVLVCGALLPSRWHVRVWDVRSATMSSGFPIDGGIPTCFLISSPGHPILFHHEGERSASGSTVKPTSSIFLVYQDPIRFGKKLSAESGVRVMSLSPNESTLLYAGSCGQDDPHGIRAIGLKPGNVARRFPGHTAAVRALVFLPDGRRFLSAGEDRTVRVWDTETGAQLTSLTGHAEAVVALAVSPSGRCALSASLDRTLRLWDLDKGEAMSCFAGHRGRVLSVAYSPDGRYALSGDEDGTVCLLALPEEG